MSILPHSSRLLANAICEPSGDHLVDRTVTVINPGEVGDLRVAASASSFALCWAVGTRFRPLLRGS